MELKRILSLASLSLVLLTSIIYFKPQIEKQIKQFRTTGKKNAIYMIPDGFGPATYTMAALAGKDLNLKNYMKGMTRTFSINSWVTDSASAGTAMSCGLRTYDGAIGVNEHDVPCKTILEAAKEKGYKVGLIVTSYIPHATPAAFSAHVKNRNMYSEIASQQISKNIDVLLGGGLKHFLPIKEGGERTDGRNLLTEARNKHGYNVVLTRADLNNANKAKLPLLGIFAKDHMPYEIDRKWVSNKDLHVPSLSEMSTIGVNLLQEACRKDPKCPGYFVMIEGSRIDHAGHDSDPGAGIQETYEFDKAFGDAVERAKRFGNTLVVSVADHACGGLTLGEYTPNNPSNSYDWYPKEINKQKMSSVSLLKILKEGKENIVDAYKKYMGVYDLTSDEIKMIQKAVSDDDTMPIARPRCNRAQVYYNYGGHDGIDVSQHAYGPTSEQFSGRLHLIDIPKKIGKWLELKGIGTLSEPIKK